MSEAGFPLRAPQAESYTTHVRFVGGTTAVTKVEGVGVAIAYTSTGIVTLTWQEPPGRFMGLQWGFQATTASAVKGYTCVPGVFNTTAYTLAINITGASEALVDLAALQWCNLAITFARTGV